MKAPTTPTKVFIPAQTVETRDLESGGDRRPMMLELYRRAKAQLRKQRKSGGAETAGEKLDTDSQRLLHELQVHQVELEMQNTELQESRAAMEVLLEKYTDLYDFAPVGYLSVDEQGRILEVNLTGAALLGLGRSQLVNRLLPAFVTPVCRLGFLEFLANVFGAGGKHVCEVTLVREGGASFWANIHGTAALSANTPAKWCRVVVSDITDLKTSEEAQRRLKELAEANHELKEEIVRRLAVEASLKKSEHQQSRLLRESQIMQDQLRLLSRQVLHAQEEERKRISRELHDVIAQTLTGINVQLAALAKATRLDVDGFERNIARTQKRVEKAVETVHEFARELRPAVLDDLGLIPALHSFMKTFTARSGVRAHLTAFAGVEQLDIARRTVLFRVAQEALTNVARHAKASRVEVGIEKLADGVCMKIKDDGKSFQPARLIPGKTGKRLGLLGMRERLEMVGGHLEVESAPGEGTTVRAEVPFGRAGGGGETHRSAPEPLTPG